MADSKLELVIQVDVDKANASIKTINRGLSGLEDAARRGAGGASSQLNSMERHAARAATSMRSLFAGVGTAIAGLGLARLAKDAIMVAADFQRGRLALEAFVGSAEKAQSLFKDIQAFAETSPFQFKDLMDGAQRLLAFKFNADQLIPTLRGISSATAALGGDSGKFQDVITALGQIRNAAKLTGEELRQLRNAGLEGAAFDALAKAYGKSVAEIQKMQRDGLIPGLEASEIIVAGLTERFQKFDEAVGKSASVAISNFKDSLMRLADEVARDLLPDLAKLLNDFRKHIPEIASAMREAIGYARSLADNFAAIGSAFVAYQIVEWVVKLTAAVRTFNLVSMGTPWGLIAGGIALVATELYRSNKEMRELQQKDFENNAIRQLVNEGKTAKDLEKLGFSLERVNEALGLDGLKAAFGDYRSTIQITGIDKRPGGNKPPRLLGSEEDAEKQAKRAAEILDRARRGEVEGVARVREEYRQYREEMGQNAKARALLVEAEAIDVARVSQKLVKDAFDDAKKWAKDYTADLKKEYEERLKDERDYYEQSLKLRTERAELDLTMTERGLQQSYQIELDAAERARDARMRAAEGVDARTVEQKIAVEQQKAGIEIEYLQQANEIKQRLFDLETSRQVLEYEMELNRLGYQAEEIRARVAELRRQRDELRDANQVATDAAIDAARQSAANRATDMIRDHNQRVFESFKRQAEGVFDALVSKSRSVWGAIADSFKTAMLTAIKEVVTSRVAVILMSMFGARVSGTAAAPAGGGGWATALGGIGIFGGARRFPGNVAGGPGGTPPFLPSGVGGGGGGPLGGLLGGSGSSGISSGWKDFFGFGGGGVQYAPGKAITWGAASLGQKLSALGRSNAALLGGATLAMMGLQRGGLSGLAMTTAGGAMIGFKYGGPIGAAIGAGVGAVAGIARLFMKGAEEKAREKIKAAYGVDISDKGVLRQIVQMAKSGFGGNLDMAIRSPQVVELIDLYKMTTGQKGHGFPATMRAVTLSSRGGTLSEQASFSNGAPLSSGFGRLGVPAGAPSGGTVVVPLQIDSKAVGSVVIQDGRVVAQGAITAMKSNAGRREMTALQLSPGTLTA